MSEKECRGGGVLTAHKEGFTLSEVLIAAVVIGVIAMVTVPVITTNYQKMAQATKFRKSVRNFSEITDVFIFEAHKTRLGQTSIFTDDSSVELDRFIQRNFRVIKVCEANKPAGCFANGEYKAIVGDDHRALECAEKSYLLSDSSAICVTKTHNTRVPLQIRVDINGPAKPNVGGKDLFMFYINDKGESAIDLLDSTAYAYPDFDRPRYIRPDFDRLVFDKPDFDRPKYNRPDYDKPDFDDGGNVFTDMLASIGNALVPPAMAAFSDGNSYCSTYTSPCASHQSGYYWFEMGRYDTCCQGPDGFYGGPNYGYVRATPTHSYSTCAYPDSACPSGVVGDGIGFLVNGTCSQVWINKMQYVGWVYNYSISDSPVWVGCPSGYEPYKATGTDPVKEIYGEYPSCAGGTGDSGGTGSGSGDCSDGYYRPNPTAACTQIPSCTINAHWNGSYCETCTSASPSWDGSKCVPSCTPGMEWTGSKCACPSSKPYWDGGSGSCVTSCPSSSPSFTCNNYCYNPCSGGMEWTGSKCACPSNIPYWDGYSCASSCPSASPYWDGSKCTICTNALYNGTCVSACPSDAPYVVYYSDSSHGAYVECVSSCPSTSPHWNGSYCESCPSNSPSWNGSECVPTCTLGKEWNNEKKECACPSGSPYWNGYQCSTCSYPSYWDGTYCLGCYSPDQYHNGTTCTCPDDKPYFNGGKCVSSCPSASPYYDGTQCTTCPSSLPYYDGSTCVSCKPEEGWINNQCKPTDCSQELKDKLHFFDYESSICRCPDGLSENAEGVCVSTPPSSGDTDSDSDNDIDNDNDNDPEADEHACTHDAMGEGCYKLLIRSNWKIRYY